MIKIKATWYLRDFWGWIMKDDNGYEAQAFLGLPIMFYRDVVNQEMFTHELTHVKQALFMLWIPFWILYVGHFIVNLFIYKNAELAYRNIVLEREAYWNQRKVNYPLTRHPWGWIKYFNKRYELGG